MKKNELTNGAADITLPPETTMPQPAEVESPPAPSAQSAQSPADHAKAVAERVKSAKRDFARQVGELVEVAGRDFCLRLMMTLSFIWLKIGEQDDYVDKTLIKLQSQHKNAWIPARTTIQHYEGPMLRWLVELARKKDPNDLNLKEKFSPTFLREHPEYIINVGDKELTKLQRECRTLVDLDQKYGNGRVKPAKTTSALPVKTTQPNTTNDAVHPAAGAPDESRAKVGSATPERKTQCKAPGKPRRPSCPAHGASDQPTNDALLEKIYAVESTMLAMKEAGVRIQRDAESALLRCCVTAKDINAHFRASETSLSA